MPACIALFLCCLFFVLMLNKHHQKPIKKGSCFLLCVAYNHFCYLTLFDGFSTKCINLLFLFAPNGLLFSFRPCRISMCGHTCRQLYGLVR